MPFLKRIVFALLGLALVSSTVPVSAGASAGVEKNQDVTGGTATLRGLEARSSFRATAQAVLRTTAADLGVATSGLRIDEVDHSISGVHVRGRQYRDGVPVDETNFAVHFVNGEAVQVDAYTSDLPGRPVDDPVSVDAAVASALRYLGVTETLVPSQTQRLLVRRDGRLIDVSRVCRAVDYATGKHNGRCLDFGRFDR